MSGAAWRALYNAALLGTALIGWPLLVLVIATRPRLRTGFLERLVPLARSDVPTVWVHAASVGEVEAALPMIRALTHRGLALRLTTQSATGRAHLARRLPELPARLAPLDLPGLAALSIRRARVRTLLLIETELWPNWMRAAQRNGGRVAVASGRLSDRSMVRYRRLRALLRPLLRDVEIAAQTELDGARFVELGAEPAHVHALGDLKLDRLEVPEPSEALLLAVGKGPLLVAGSTHPGEEEPLVDAWRALLPEAPSLRLVLAPRHPERAVAVLESLRARGVAAELRSRGAAAAPVVVLDTLGELAALYRLATLAFVGGTLVPIGGHSLMEPVAAGRVVVHGPHVHNQRAQVERLRPLGVLVEVSGADGLPAALRALWADRLRDAPAAAARDVLMQSRGAVARVLDWLDERELLPRVA